MQTHFHWRSAHRRKVRELCVQGARVLLALLPVHRQLLHQASELQLPGTGQLPDGEMSLLHQQNGVPTRGVRGVLCRQAPKKKQLPK